MVDRLSESEAFEMVLLLWAGSESLRIILVYLEGMEGVVLDSEPAKRREFLELAMRERRKFLSMMCLFREGDFDI